VRGTTKLQLAAIKGNGINGMKENVKGKANNAL
jgi:hypothetical protein